MLRLIKESHWKLMGVAFVFLLWECNAQLHLFKLFAPSLPPRFFPSLATILVLTAQSAVSSEYLWAAGLTISRTLVAFVVSSFSGLLLALLGANVPRLHAMVEYAFEFCRQLPAVAIIPFAILFFGVDSQMKIAVAFFGCFFPTYIGAVQALRSIDPLLLLTAERYGWRGGSLLFGVMLPAVFPAVSAMMRVTLSIALILVIMAEMLVGGDGLGGRLSMFELSFRLDSLYAETLLLGVLGVSLNGSFAYLVRRTYYWHESRTLS